MDHKLHPPRAITRFGISDWQTIAGDASGRQYWRVGLAKGGTAVLCLYPEHMRPLVNRDLEVLIWLRQQGVSVPRVQVGHSCSLWMMLEDLGRSDGEADLRKSSPASRPGRVFAFLEPLIRLSGIPTDRLPAWNPAFDINLLRWELAGFELWGLAQTRKKAGSAVGSWLDELAAAVARHPRTICLRDFHLNNILVNDQGDVGVIDVQDLRLGPDTYDLASLLADRAAPELLSPDQRHIVSAKWADSTGAVPGWEQRLMEMTLQRSLKVLGTFAFLQAKGLRQYQRWVPDTASTALEIAATLDAPKEAITILLDLTATGGFDVW